MKTLMTFVVMAFIWTPVLSSMPSVEPFNPEVVIPESEIRNFTQDPIAYISENFDLKGHPTFIQFEGESEFSVIFKCAKGYLVANYDSRGDLVSTRQRFKNISLPSEIMAEIYRDYKGWEVTDIDYRASGKRNTVKSKRYIIELTKDGEIEVLNKKIKY